MLTLYLKTHNITGKKYLGKTKKNPLKYKGSGTDWNSHLEKYGDDVSTKVLFQTESKSKLKSQGQYYSELWDIVRSKEFLNKKIESGDGGGAPWTDERREKDDTADRIWITDGKSSKRVLSGYIPEGWTRGRTKYDYPVDRQSTSHYYVNGQEYSYKEAKMKYGTRFTKAVSRMNKKEMDVYETRQIRGYCPLIIERSTK